MTHHYSHFNSTPYETHMLVYEKIKPGSEVCDIGCAGGYFARKLEEKNCRVFGIDSDKEALKEAKKYCERVVLIDLENIEDIPSQKKFDYILLLDVVEHLKNPKKVLLLVKKYLKKNGKIIISTPNIAFISARLALFFGRFDYQTFGIMDKNHVRFYTKKTLLDLISNCGLKLEELDVASGFSQITKIGKYLNHIPKYWQYKVTKVFDTLLGYQFIASCHPEFISGSTRF